MAPVQTEYEINHDAAVAGAITSAQLTNIRSATATGVIPFGRIAVLDNTGNLASLIDAAGDLTRLIGITARIQNEVANAADVLQIEANREANLVTHGEVWVESLTAIGAGPVFVIPSGANAGKIRVDAGSGGDAGVQNAVTDAVLTCMSSSFSPGLVKLRISL